MVPLLVLAVLLGVMVVSFVWFFIYSRTLAWGDSPTRKAILNMLIVMGPVFGMHYRREPPEPPAITTTDGGDGAREPRGS